jgi:multidrug transporter EmrE-like cation transporter
MRYALALAIALTLNAAANLLMKAGMKPIEQAGGVLKDGLWVAVRTVLTTAPLVIGLACFALNAAFYMYALQSRKLPISIAYPIMVGGGYALIALIAHWHPALRESLNWGQKLGVALVLLGVFVIAYQTKSAS